MIFVDCAKCALKRKFGDFKKIEYISTENLFKESNRKGCSSRPLAELCEELIGTPVEKSCRLSDRVCKACGRKVRNAQAVQKLVLAINDTNRSGENEADGDRFKRQLPTTVNSPDRSAQNRNGAKTANKTRSSAKKMLLKFLLFLFLRHLLI